ncbi:hypothetical protein HYALB_00001436 [Hymenoscyphus albidus]|uniref:Expansin-like EG45 domain-containing protein n=1 Tax=Hymenoscyphus albidus TaxID=595503 RepID=A0A9N9L9X2_9HELO|nr:hypothetical protein HYALB_00001436 [Hymenoscyphus albidus]
MLFSTTLAATAVISLANAAVMGKRALIGEATFYGGNVQGGTCSFSTYTIPSSLYGAALSDSNWDNSANCGACISVTGPSGNAVTAMIVDQCPGCGTNHLDLFPTGFSALADPSKGIIPVSWSYVDCPITGPLQLHNKEGVSANWFSMQVVNANKAVKSLEVSTDGGSTWKSTSRQTYNFFENSAGFGTTTVDVKVTSSSGETVVVKNIVVSPGASTTAGSNFGSSGNVVAAAPPPVLPPSPPATPVLEAPVLEAPVVPTPAPVVLATPNAPALTTTSSSKKATTLAWIPKPTSVELDACGQEI